MAIYLVNLDGYESAQEAVDSVEAIRLARCEEPGALWLLQTLLH